MKKRKIKQQKEEEKKTEPTISKTIFGKKRN